LCNAATAKEWICYNQAMVIQLPELPLAALDLADGLEDFHSRLESLLIHGKKAAYKFLCPCSEDKLEVSITMDEQ